MKKILLSSVIVATLLSGSLFAKAINVNGEEINQEKLCTGLEDSLPYLFKVIESYYSITEGKKTSCNDIKVLSLEEISSSPLYGNLIRLNYEKNKCLDKINFDKIVEQAIVDKADTTEKFDILLRKNGITNFENYCE